ncbi:MAG: DUF2269 family protein [Proteobacteria bacterium]|nr:DUF2269 family protein [Pseudomonadota bacterium]
MRKALKFIHTVASCGLVGALAGYAIVLLWAPQDTPRAYADVRQSISLLSSYLLLPSLGVALVSGLFAMAAHRAFLDTRWAWLKAILGLSTFEATLAIVQGKSTSAAVAAAKIAAGEGGAAVAELADVISNEWLSLGLIMALSMAQIAIGVWRPRMAFK